ncbi:MFS transporter [Bifidobacterium tibiigranuli]|uniref:MFS transporter n=1 Tax=Bifidobacterium tibiigranuli TaxID=2172043 RepID=UPI0026F32068|nr:MFS transporter [Bifidobacterium tibiigranuli]MCI1649254.1 MFS transporter [Bifidobacterium tibiigranuli]MCI2185823.1 MFS transporter [Bifidobacterium tibiigranuli]MCI2203134.1 MFS transporter [Bifidobacterium tibiigranuli]
MANLLLAVIYIAFISLGLPDSLLGSAWPTMSHDLGAPLSWAGGISMVISAGTIISALLSDRMTLRFGVGKVMLISVATTAVALLGFSLAPNYWTLLLVAIPYGLGAGGVDAALNNYVAIHYASRHMSWLHCMWGVGASLGPYIMGFALTRGQGWSWGYRYIAILQVVLTVVLTLSLPLWKGRESAATGKGDAPESAGKSHASDKPVESVNAGKAVKPLGFRQIIAIPGAKSVFVTFFCYCAVESTAGLWASSYMVLHHGLDAKTAASWASLFYVGITIGRALSGFMTMRFNDPTMIRIGQTIMLCGIVLLMVPFPGQIMALVGLILVGLGCAPIYPCIIHSTPAYFGADKSQAIVGVQMASAYVGALAMPPLFGLIADHTSISLYPIFLLLILVIMVMMHELLRSTARRAV